MNRSLYSLRLQAQGGFGMYSHRQRRTILVISHRFVVNIKLVTYKALRIVFILLLCFNVGGVHVWSAHMCVKASVETRGRHQTPYSISPSYSLETVFSTEPRAWLAANRNPQ